MDLIKLAAGAVAHTGLYSMMTVHATAIPLIVAVHQVVVVVVVHHHVAAVVQLHVLCIMTVVVGVGVACDSGGD